MGSDRLRFSRSACGLSLGRQTPPDPVRRLRLESGDVAVWGGPARFVYHGVGPLSPGNSTYWRHPHQSHFPEGLLILMSHNGR